MSHWAVTLPWRIAVVVTHSVPNDDTSASHLSLPPICQCHTGLSPSHGDSVPNDDTSASHLSVSHWAVTLPWRIAVVVTHSVPNDDTSASHLSLPPICQCHTGLSPSHGDSVPNDDTSASHLSVSHWAVTLPWRIAVVITDSVPNDDTSASHLSHWTIHSS